MREILFRGKRTSNGEWVEGYLVKGRWYIDESPITAIIPLDNTFYPHCEIEGWHEVIPETIGQYTGLTDKNGKRIFEGDIVKTERTLWSGENKKEREVFCSVVRYSEKDCSFGLHGKYRHLTIFRFKGDWNEVIGNIHDHPKLIKEGTQ